MWTLWAPKVSTSKAAAPPDMTAHHPDQLINNCIVGRARSGWSWVCVQCGVGKVSGKSLSHMELTIHNARVHQCQTSATHVPGVPATEHM